MKSHLRVSLCLLLSSILAFGAPLGAFAETFPTKLDQWVGFRSIEDGWWSNVKKSVVKFAQYNDFFSPTLTNGAKLYVQESENAGVATLKEANCTLSIEVGRIWDSYYALCSGKKIGLLKPTGFSFGKVPTVVVKGPPEQVKTDPNAGKSGNTGTVTVPPKKKEDQVDPVVDPVVDPDKDKKKDDVVTPGDNTTTKTPFDQALEKLATLFAGKKVPPAVIEFLAGKDESTKKAFVEWMGKAETSAESLLKEYKILDEVMNAILGKNAPMLTWLADKKQIAEKDLLQFLCPETEKTTVTREEVKSTTIKGQAGNIATGNGNFDDNTNAVVTAPTGSSFPKEILDKCDALKKQQALDDARNTPSGDPNTLPTNTVPDPNLNTGQQGNLTISPDKEDAKKDESKKKSDMMRCALGGAYGAVAFGILGMIFGGPFGLVLGAAFGFGLLAGMTYLNNNKIK